MPKRWSKLWFSSKITTTCLIGVVVFAELLTVTAPALPAWSNEKAPRVAARATPTPTNKVNPNR